MVPPMGKTTVVLGEVGKVTQPFNQLKVEYVNDYGGNSTIETPVSASP